jgi:hypothetical protein
MGGVGKAVGTAPAMAVRRGRLDPKLRSQRRHGVFPCTTQG